MLVFVAYIHAIDAQSNVSYSKQHVIIEIPEVNVKNVTLKILLNDKTVH